jgi:hypothetical protein
MRWLAFRLPVVAMGVLLAVASTLNPTGGQPIVGGWQSGPGAAGDNTYAGVIDSPANGSSVATLGPISMSGWFVDATAQGWAGADDMQVFLGSMDTGTLLARGNVGLNRPDVGAALANPYWAAAGWMAAFDASRLPAGHDTLSVYLHVPTKGWWSQQVMVTVGEGSGELLAPAPAVQGAPPLVSVTSPQEGEYVSTRDRKYVIRGTARDAANGARGIDWVELWLNGEAFGDHAIRLGDAELAGDGSWSLNFDPANYDTINSNLYVYAHSGVNAKRSLVVVHFYITHRAVSR